MIIANMATYPPRRQQLNNVVATISPQVDRLNIVLNEYDAVPEELEKYPNVIPLIPDEDLKDTGKFLPNTQEAKYVLLIDDDISYPTDYVSKTVERFESLNFPNCVGGYHASFYLKPQLGQILRSPSLLFTRHKRVADFRDGKFCFYYGLKMATVVDQLGTGTAIMHGKDMPPFEYMRTSQKYVDVRFGRWCFEHGMIPVSLPRANKWIDVLGTDESIYSNFTLTNPAHVSREILTYAFKVKHRGLPVNEISNLENQ